MAVSPFKPLLRFLTPTYVHKRTLFLSPCLNKVERDEERQLFLYTFENGEGCVCYKRINGILELKHTSIPEKFRGHGIGVSLAKSVLDYCLKNNIKVKLTCPYLQRFYSENAQLYKSIVV